MRIGQTAAVAVTARRRRRGGGGGGVQFGEDEYFLAFVGTPSVTTPWMLQFGGHHLAINLTMAGSQATMAPSLPATQPATYTFEGRTIRPLGNENDKAFALINALDDAQRKQAILGYTRRRSRARARPGWTRRFSPRAFARRRSRRAAADDAAGYRAGVGGHPERRVRRSREWPRSGRTFPETYFAWSGPTTNGSAAYFRIQGPTLVIEYAPQGGVDHIHTIYRDPTNDYGAKFTKK